MEQVTHTHTERERGAKKMDHISEQVFRIVIVVFHSEAVVENHGTNRYLIVNMLTFQVCIRVSAAI